MKQRRAPDFRDDPASWCVWMLDVNPHLYAEYRDAADYLFRSNPNAKRVSSDMILHYVRFMTTARATGDVFKVSNYASAFFSRLYTFERPQHADKFEKRDSALDHLPEWKRALINDAYARMRARE